THTATIEDNEVGTINFQADQSNDESVSPTGKATLTIATTGTVGATGLDVALTVSATDALTGTATSGTDYTAFGPATLTFAAGNGASIDSSTAPLTVQDDKRLECDVSVKLALGRLSSPSFPTRRSSDLTHTATIEDNEVGTINFQADQSNDESVSPT